MYFYFSKNLSFFARKEYRLAVWHRKGDSCIRCTAAVNHRKEKGSDSKQQLEFTQIGPDGPDRRVLDAAYIEMLIEFTKIGKSACQSDNGDKYYQNVKKDAV